jgi:hypothetical protein
MGNENRIGQRINPGRIGFFAQLAEVSSALRRIDIFVFALIIGFSALQFFCVSQAKDFPGDEVFFADSGRSLVEHGFYGINGYAETNMPPGLPAILGFLSATIGYSRPLFLHVMVVTATLGLLLTYELLRRQTSRAVAAAICLLFISSRVHFDLVTQSIWPSYPYFVATMAALLAARKFEEAKSWVPRIAWGVVLTVLVAASLLFASAAIALLGGIVASIGVTFCRDRRLGFARLRTYLAVLLVGIAVEGLWMQRDRVSASAGIAAAEWPVPGFPHSYLSQLKVKSGNYPELGMATPGDVVARVVKNASAHANLLSRILLRRLPQLAYVSIFVAGPVILVALGWFRSVWRTGGGVQDWYFAGYEFIYLLWPWDPETRFFLPIAPLACLYLWRGGQELVFLAESNPRVVGMVWLPVAAILASGTWEWMHGSGFASQFPNVGLEDEFSFAVWLLSGIVAAWMVWAGTRWLTPASAFGRLCSMLGRARRITSSPVVALLGTMAFVGLLLAGLVLQIRIGSINRDPDSDINQLSSDAEAGKWIRSHVRADAIVMARQVPTVVHYSNRKVIWFPPSSNARLLMDGIVKHRVNFVLVVRREAFVYYRPSDDDCFVPLFRDYPGAFRLIYQVPDFRVYQVAATARPLGSLRPKSGEWGFGLAWFDLGVHHGLLGVSAFGRTPETARDCSSFVRRKSPALRDSSNTTNLLGPEGRDKHLGSVPVKGGRRNSVIL